MFLRPYRKEDKRRIQQLFFETVHTVNAQAYSPAQLDAWAPAQPDRDIWARFETLNCFVVEDCKRLVGFAAVSDEGSLELLYVHQNAQGQGIGRALLKQATRLAVKKGCPVLGVEASANSLRFFEKNGFSRRTEVLKEVGGVTIFLLYMEKMLTPRASQT